MAKQAQKPNPPSSDLDEIVKDEILREKIRRYVSPPRHETWTKHPLLILFAGFFLTAVVGQYLNKVIQQSTRQRERQELAETTQRANVTALIDSALGYMIAIQDDHSELIQDLADAAPPLTSKERAAKKREPYYVFPSAQMRKRALLSVRKASLDRVADAVCIAGDTAISRELSEFSKYVFTDVPFFLTYYTRVRSDTVGRWLEDNRGTISNLILKIDESMVFWSNPNNPVTSYDPARMSVCNLLRASHGASSIQRFIVGTVSAFPIPKY